MKTERQKKHAKYLASEEWAKVRADLFTLRGEKCEVCGSGKYLQIHHLTYKNWMAEEPGDLIILCSGCHMVEHNKTISAKHTNRIVKAIKKVKSEAPAPKQMNKQEKKLAKLLTRIVSNGGLSKKDKKTVLNWTLQYTY